MLASSHQQFFLKYTNSESIATTIASHHGFSQSDINKYNPSTTNTNSQLNNNKFSSNNQFNTMGSPISPTWYHPKRPSFQPTNSHTKPNQPDEVPILMSGAGHDAMAMSRLTKVLTSFLFLSVYWFVSSLNFLFLDTQLLVY
jgi:hypothetical protein